MYGYKNSIRLCLVEYFLALAVHIIYAFVKHGMEKGRMVLLFSAVMITLTFIMTVMINNEKIVVAFLFFSVLLSTTVIGCVLETLAFSVLIFSVMTTSISIMMEAKYIIYSGAGSALTFLAYTIFLPDYILKNVPSLLIFGFYIIIYFCSSINLYVVVYYAKRYMKGMEEKAEEADRANESKMRFLANMSHEIRTPMNAICGMAELTLREELSPEVKDNVENIQTAGKVLISIVNDILDYSKLESGKMEVIPVTYSFHQMISDVLNMMRIRLEDKEVELRSNIKDDIPDMLMGDEIRIRQILFNLLSNAIKYTDKGYVILDVTGKENDGFLDLTVSVTDSGIGIKKEDIPKLFSSFQQVDTRKTRNREGTGLGLAICKQLLTLMGGDITVESTYGVGSKFTFTVSQKISDGDQDLNTETISNEKENSRVVGNNAKVLVVDDNAVNLKVAQGLIRTYGIEVDTCMSGRQCLEILKTHKDYDIIFIDHMMPELDGIDTLNLIRADSDEYMQKVPLIALTANVVSGVREMFISEGFNDYVPKPIDMVWLNGILRKYLPSDKQR
ncbi:MAG: response regulator [Lachnospiraceae bacterium]|nr:response regulator [Lachnospiraceae bacterium]